MQKIIDVLKKILKGLQTAGEYIAEGIEIIGNLITWLTDLVAKGVRGVFGIKR